MSVAFLLLGLSPCWPLIAHHSFLILSAEFSGMERRIISTKDGSQTIEVPELKVTYHSRHGALEESRHVFIDAGLGEGLRVFGGGPIAVFEMGFGTGLNALLTAIEAKGGSTTITYHSIEAAPLTMEEAMALDYGQALHERELFRQLHAAPWDMETRISDYFIIRKDALRLEELQTTERFHVIYYDAFAPAAQPELWTEERFRQLYELLLPGGLLVTYCSKSVVRHAMTAAGFYVTKPAGPWGKREMVRANRPHPPAPLQGERGAPVV
jgi:tRNA U34 5-methylaminomethyl-2-thiouridine-forming methyltransferase MnmC